METIQRGDQLIGYDKTRTMRAYAALLHGGCEDCGCSSCLNFAAQRDKAYPEDFRALLASLGIDSSKEGEVYECGPAGDLHLYGGWFYFSGNVLEPGERLSKADGGFEYYFSKADGGFEYYFVDASRLPKPSVDFGDDVAAVEFQAKIPWVLPQKP